jgi:transposase-like protein
MRRLTPVQIRQSRYLNNLIEQDHRGIKRRMRSMLGFKSIASARDPGRDRNDPHDAETAVELCPQSATVARRALQSPGSVIDLALVKPSFGIKSRFATQLSIGAELWV